MQFEHFGDLASHLIFFRQQKSQACSSVSRATSRRWLRTSIDYLDRHLPVSAPMIWSALVGPSSSGFSQRAVPYSIAILRMVCSVGEKLLAGDVVMNVWSADFVAEFDMWLVVDAD